MTSKKSQVAKKSTAKKVAKKRTRTRTIKYIPETGRFSKAEIKRVVREVKAAHSEGSKA